MPVTIRDLAEKLDLSITTVSRALDGYDDVSEGTRLRVINAAREMGYEPSYAARQLRRKRSDAIGFILPTSSPRFSDPYYVNFLTGLCDEVATQQLDLVITSYPPESEQEKEQYRRWAKSRRVDGIILNRTRVNDWRMAYLSQSGIPFAFLGKGEDNSPNPFIDINDTDAVKDLVIHLARKGHQRIAFIGASPNLIIHMDRLRGYQMGLEEAQLPFHEDMVQQGDLTEASGYTITKKLLELPNPPTAILGINDLTALGVLHAAKEKGLYIGTELAIAGYDGIQETEYTSPPLTTIRQPTYDIARELVRMLLKVIEGSPGEQNHHSITPQIVVRASTG